MSFARVDARTTARPSRAVLSVGIDVGTTTTQVVFSRLSVADVARPNQVPRLEITDKSVVHQGMPQFTPLLSPEEVDAAGLEQLVAAEYAQAGVCREDIETGAVIVTGEIARAQNAERILAALSEWAGDFIVAVAGPAAEARISGMGAGVSAWSAENYATVTNVDIGGGTANAATFRAGAHQDSAAIAVGGRIIRIDATGRITGLAPGAAVLAAVTGIPLQIGATLTLEQVQTLCRVMADRIVDLVRGRAVEPELMLTPPLAGERARALFLSGGVGTCYYRELPAATLPDIARYGDVGPAFAAQLRAHPDLVGVTVVEPDETIQATVLGAASQTVTVSGSTIWYAQDLLPLQNLPVIEAGVLSEGTDFGAAVAAALRARDLSEDTDCAVIVDVPAGADFARIIALAATITATWPTRADRPLVLILEKDYGQVLGQAIHTIAPDLRLLVVDQIGLGEGDYVDIGEALFGGRAVPIAIKTLVFYESEASD